MAPLNLPKLKQILCCSLLVVMSSCSSGDLDSEVSHGYSSHIETTTLSGDLEASLYSDNNNDDISAFSAQDEPVATDLQASDQAPSTETDSLETQGPLSSDPSPSPQPQVVASQDHVFTLDLSKQSIGDVDLVIALDNSALMAQHIRKFEAVFSEFLTTTASAIDGTLNTTILSCSRDTNDQSTDNCLTMDSSLASQLYHIPLSIYGGHMGMGWIKNIVEGQTLLTHDTPSRDWVTINRSKVFKQHYKKFFLIVTNHVKYTSQERDQLKSSIATHLTHSGVNFASIAPLKKEGKNKGCQLLAVYDKNLSSLAKFYDGKPYPICADADAYKTYFTDITSRIETLSWGSIDIAKLSADQRKRIAKVTLDGTVYDHAIRTIAGSSLLFVDVPTNTQDNAEIVVTVNDP